MTLDAHPFANASPPPTAPTHRRLPSSTSETALFKPSQPRTAPPPAQPCKIRPFILRGQAKGKENDADAGKGKETPGGMRRSKTSHDIEASADGRVAPPTAEQSLRRGVRGEAGTSEAPTRRKSGLSFGLAMTSGSRGPRSASPAPANAARRVEERLSRASRTEDAEGPRQRPSPRPLSLAASSLRALSSTSSSTSSSRASLRPASYTRRISYVVPSSPSPSPTQSPADAPPASPRSPSLEQDPSKLERVEKHKIELKRQMVAKRREAVTAPVDEPAVLTTSPASRPPAPPVLPPTPTSLPSTSLPPPRNALSTPRRPTHETGARERKRDMYGELGLGFGAPTSHGEEQEEGERKGEEREERERGGYSSLQELLERHGYADTRVITPQSTLARPTAPHASSDAPTSPTPARSRSPSPAPPAEPTSSLAPPAPQLKDRPSLLSLRGLFSLFGSPNPDSSSSPPLPSPTSSGSTARAADADADTSSVHHVVLSTPPPSSCVQPRRMRTTSEMHRWVSGVNEAIRPRPHPHPLSRVSTSLESDARTPELCFDLAPGQDAEDEDEEEDARSYSSSVSFELATRTPQTNFVGGMGEGYLSPSWGGGNDELSAPFGLEAASKRKSLRHTVSDSNLLPAYQSFAGLGIQVPPSPPHAVSITAEQEEKEPRRPPTPVASGRLWWAPATLLRERASQLFFPPSASSSSPNASASPTLAAAPFPRSPIDAATGRSLLPSSSSRALHTRRSQPQLLRRAISTAGLVAPATVRQIRVVAKSSRDSLGSLESCVLVGGSVSGDEGEREGGMVPSWGEDLLGRRW